MNKRMQNQRVHMRQRERVAVEDAADDDMWCWGVIFSAAAITALCVAMLFCISTG
jgi:hypothetical protein